MELEGSLLGGREGVGKIWEKEAGDEGSTGVKETLKNLLWWVAARFEE